MVRAYGNHWTRRTCGEVHDVFALETGCIHVVIIYLEQVVASMALRRHIKFTLRPGRRKRTFTLQNLPSQVISSQSAPPFILLLSPEQDKKLPPSAWYP